MSQPTPMQLFDDVLSGKATLRDLQNWVDVVREEYTRPQMSGILQLSHEERQRVLQMYSAWEKQQDELGNVLSRAHTVANESADAEGKLMTLLAAETLSELVPPAVNRAGLSWRVGYLLWKGERFAEAIAHLSLAAELFNGIENKTYQELMSLSYLIPCLRKNHQREEALKVVERLLNRARETGSQASEAVALRDRGMLLSELGRPGAIADLIAALELRRGLSNDDVRRYGVSDQAGFLNDLGTESRKEGRFEHAIIAFLELVEMQRHRGDPSSEARALSDLGYTYHGLSEDSRAANYLLQAAGLAEKIGENREAGRWRRQASVLSGTVSADEAEAIAADLPIVDSWHAYEAASVVELLLKRERFAQALTSAEAVLAWARKNKDFGIELSMLNNIAGCHLRTGNPRAAIPLFQQGIRLANGLNHRAVSLSIHYNLARAFLLAGKTRLATDVLWTSLALGELLLNATSGTETRQQVAATLLGIHETFALLCSQTENHENMIATTEMARAKNLLGWIRASNAVAGVPEARRLVEHLYELRQSEVEVEVHQLTGVLTADEMQAAVQRRANIRQSLNEELIGRGFPAIHWSTEPNDLIGDINSSLRDAVSEGERILFLFSVPEGVCVAVAGMNGEEVHVRGTFVSWERRARTADFEPWLPSTDTISAYDCPDSLSERLQKSIEAIRKNLFEPIAELLNLEDGANLVVVAQGDLALLPYWDLLDLAGGCGSLCLAPSLEVYRVCRHRARAHNGSSLFVPDITGSLPFSRIELAMGCSARPGGILETKADRIVAQARNAALVHICGHGVFNPENPYLGGVIVRERAGESAHFAQYVAAPRIFSSKPTADSWRLLTVAECMAELSLDRCRVAILSACESGVPRLHRGGEMVGLPNAFILAGAKSVIATLWRIHDAAAALLVGYFYQEWEGGHGETVGVAASLRNARHRLRTASRSEIDRLLGRVHDLPEGEFPFAGAFFSDAFHCFGAM